MWSLQGGVLNLKPLAFGFTQGKLMGSLKIDARKPVAVTSIVAGLATAAFSRRGLSPERPAATVAMRKACRTSRPRFTATAACATPTRTT